MFVINEEDKSIYVTRGDAMMIGVTMSDDEGNPQNFLEGDTVRLKIYAKKNASNVVLTKDYLVVSERASVEIYLSSDDTKIGGEISKPKDYWYEIELNPDGDTQTIIGYDGDGAKVFRLFPEGGDYLMEDEANE